MAEKLTRRDVWDVEDGSMKAKYYVADEVDALVRSLRALVEELRAEGARCDTFHATMGVGYKASAERLAARLPAPPPETVNR